MKLPRSTKSGILLQFITCLALTGVINVNIEETKDGTITITALPPDEEEEYPTSETSSSRDNDTIIINDNERWKRALMQVEPTEEQNARERFVSVLNCA